MAAPQPLPPHRRRTTHHAFAALAVTCALAAPAGAREILDGIAAQVDNQVVLISEVHEIAGPIEERMRAQGVRDADVLMMRSDVLDRLIDNKLVHNMVFRLELRASEEDVDAAIAGIAGETGLSVEQLVRSVTSHGLTFDEYRAKIRDEIERSKVIGAVVRSKVRVSESEVKISFLERFGEQPKGGVEVQLRHIVIAFGEELGRDQEAACSIAEDGLARIRGGALSFPAAARQISNANAERGGDIGWIHRRDLAAWMAPAVRVLEPGDVSDVIEMPFGCNLLQLVERRDFVPVTLEQASPQIEQRLYQQKTEQEFMRWIATVRAQSYIERKGIFAEASRLTRGLDEAGVR
jgi:peptidyl-prolyl cis-trans isomerase SurA